MRSPFREPSDPAWQFVGIILSAIGVVISMFSLPDSTRLAGTTIVLGGLIVCFAIARRWGKVRSTTVSSQAKNTPTPSKLQGRALSQSPKVGSSLINKPIPDSNTLAVTRSSFFSTLIIYMVLVGVFGLISYFVTA